MMACRYTSLRSALEVTGAEFKVQGSRFRVEGWGDGLREPQPDSVGELRVQGSEFKVQSFGFKVESWGDGLREPQPDRGGEWEGCLEWKSGLELEGWRVV
ncbi:hypothetical protein SAMN05660493_00878 [Epilithonimonas bovis DSM 19482]|uniref:Uncharacterized protein n=1 Tax=Epilithonimonas bovis DSM 19482 TaxID=1121284 RepID=A0A1U7PRL0_9FLAO|nr:hypothetical protein SAMN05660493_00878 [Epilithonimonas bovis DSM 19482]